MKVALSKNFDFHEEGKKCKCSLSIACQLPFGLGEVSGDFVGDGLDEMVAHSLKIVNAMLQKGAFRVRSSKYRFSGTKSLQK